MFDPQQLEKPYIIAEIGANHNGDVELAKKLVGQAKKCGCDAVKFQLWEADTAHTDSYVEKISKEVTHIDSASMANPELGLKNVRDQLERFSFGKDEHVLMKQYCDQVGIDFASTCLTENDLDFLVQLEVDFLKIASQDLDHPLFIEYIAKENYPCILSTGLGTLGEIEAAVNKFRSHFYLNNLVLLHCVSLYPPDDSIINLNMIDTLKDLFNVTVGYSDHTIGFSIPLAAIAKGAMVIEKHFTLDKNMPGWDHKVSADPTEMSILCAEAPRVHKALGHKNREITDLENKKKDHFRRSVVTIAPIKSGEKITQDKIFFKRPGTGIHPNEVQYVVGRTAKVNIPADEVILWDDLI